MILLSVPDWIAQVFGIGFVSLAFIIALILTWCLFFEFLWQHKSQYKTIFYGMWSLKKGNGKSYTIKIDGKETYWKKVKS